MISDTDLSGISVSIVVPVRNEEKYISACLDTILNQDFDSSKLEIIFVDGASGDRTKDIISEYMQKYSRIKLFNNPKKTVPFGMNAGIREAKGRYIVRMDAHCVYNNDYVSKSIECLEKTGADNAGGIAVTKGKSEMGSIIALMFSCVFGVGDSAVRIGNKSGYVDTVLFGAFRKELFNRIGMYDERLTRNQDNELNYRIRKNGGKIFMSEDIKFTYFCRENIRDIIKMAYKNGLWNIYTMFLNPEVMGARHIIPFFFVLYICLFIIAGVLAFKSFIFYILAAILVLYIVLDIYFSIKRSFNGKWYYFFVLLFLFPAFHISYGLGSLSGIFTYWKFRKANKNIGM